MGAGLAALTKENAGLTNRSMPAFPIQTIGTQTARKAGATKETCKAPASLGMLGTSSGSRPAKSSGTRRDPSAHAGGEVLRPDANSRMPTFPIDTIGTQRGPSAHAVRSG